MSDSVETSAQQIVVGGYTAEMEGGATGVREVRLDADHAVVGESTVALTSPTYLLAHPAEPWVFAVGEASPGEVSSLAVAADGLRLISTVPSGGDGGCHLALSADANYLLVAHYTSGSVASMRIEDGGRLSGPVSVLAFEGSGPDGDRQDAAHAHQVVSIGGVFLVPDLGSDALRLVHLDADGELSIAGDSIALPAGTGPRHLVLTHDHLVVACELTAQLWVKSLSTDLAEPGHLVAASGLQPASGVRIYPSGIVATEHHVVVANRGVDTLAVFVLDPGASTLALVAEVPSGGVWPRDVTVVGDQLWVANQTDDVVAIFDVTPTAPYLTLAGTVASPSPACVLVS
ncbi:MAG: lactonase family protein [Propionibacteriaceae bacterium]